jgi:hypothetical protein
MSGALVGGVDAFDLGIIGNKHTLAHVGGGLSHGGVLDDGLAIGTEPDGAVAVGVGEGAVLPRALETESALRRDGRVR